MLLADKIASEQIYGTNPLKVEDVQELLKLGSEIDISERAYSYVNDLVSINAINFSDNSIINWGRISDIEDTVVINTTALNSELGEARDIRQRPIEWVNGLEKGLLLKSYLKKANYKGGKVIRLQD